MTYWIETPRNAATTTLPRSTLEPSGTASPPGTSVIFSGRTPTRTSPAHAPQRSTGTCSVGAVVGLDLRVAVVARLMRASTRFEMPRKLATNAVCGRS